mgnify:CR=1 FL=1|jgi:hypothetical protein
MDINKPDDLRARVEITRSSLNVFGSILMLEILYQNLTLYNSNNCPN